MKFPKSSLEFTYLAKLDFWEYPFFLHHPGDLPSLPSDGDFRAFLETPEGLDGLCKSKLLVMSSSGVMLSFLGSGRKRKLERGLQESCAVVAEGGECPSP